MFKGNGSKKSTNRTHQIVKHKLRSEHFPEEKSSHCCSSRRIIRKISKFNHEKKLTFYNKYIFIRLKTVP